MNCPIRTIPFIVAIAFLIGCSGALAEGARKEQSSPSDSKVIEWGWGTPSPVQAAELLPKMQPRPFDGLCFTLYANGLHNPALGKARGRAFSSHNWGRERLTAEDFRESSAALKSMSWGRFIENFLRFKLDPDDVGEQEKWYATGLDDSKWDTIEIRQWWEPQGYRYDGVAWYRRTIQAPPSAKGRKLYLAFGAVDESAWLYVNGLRAGDHDQGEYGWDKRFLVDVTDQLRPGEPNQITVMVYDRGAYGGIWKSVKLIAPRE